MKLILKYCLIIFLPILGSCDQPKKTLFTLLPETASGIAFQNTLQETDSLNILDYLYFYNGGGVAMGDINNDGLTDLFFTSNQGKNHLYLNEGDLKFKDISETAGIQGNSSWNTGCILVDVNGDGWLDIYVTAVVGINSFEGHNELFINNGDATFSEKSKEFGLDLKCFSTSAAFLDYDLDGDMDLYVLNHAVHTQESFGRAQIRNERNEKTGDKLLRNDGDSFTDVSEEAGIYGGVNGYGLGIAVADFNKDGFPDIYVGNDFHEDDYYYLNNGDGTFTESLKLYFGHTSRFSMGNDAADINHDGWPDLISLDMLAEDDSVIKSSEGDDMYQTLKMRTEQYGYHYQYSRNMLFTSQPGKPYLETALLSGVAATDWSWSALFADYDLDGEKDLFISNGIPKRPNNLDYIKFISSEQIQRTLNDSRLVDQKAIEMMPSGKASNYFFKGDGQLHFQNVTRAWSPDQPGISGASALGDLDNDGDLDLVTNNINEVAGVYINTTNGKGNFIELRLKYQGKNPQGFGSKVYCYSGGKMQYQELYTVRGFQASSQPLIHFGLGKNKNIDSLVIVWPDRMEQTIFNVSGNQLAQIGYSEVHPPALKVQSTPLLFNKLPGSLGIDYTHKEDNHTDFNYQKLIPYEVSDRGPAVAQGDLNGDGKEDIYIGGAKNQPPKIFIQSENDFQIAHYPEIIRDSVYEDVTAEVVFSKNLKKGTLKVGSGGNVVSPSLKILNDRYYVIEKSRVSVQPLLQESVNTGVITSRDAYTFIGNYCSPLDFGKVPDSYLLKDGKVHQTFEELGLVTDAVWDDFDGDGETDLIVIGEWMGPKFFKNVQGNFTETSVLKESLHGLWRSILPFDMDGDGDIDYLLGNWGLNSKFHATPDAPMKMYYSDFDNNGTTETILAVARKGKYYPLLGLDELASQLVFLRKRFNNYKDFAGKSVEEIFGDALKNATVFEVQTLASGFLRNHENTFTFEMFPSSLQISPITDFVKFDFNKDGEEEVLAGGNYFGVIPFHGRFDSSPGAMIYSDKKYQLGSELGLDLTQKSVRHLNIVTLKNKPYLLIVYNNEKAEVYEINQ